MPASATTVVLYFATPAIFGLVMGCVLKFFLAWVKKLINLLNDPVAKEFSVYAYWILVGAAFMTVYIVFIRHSWMGRTTFATVSVFLSAVLPFSSAWLVHKFRQLRGIPRSATTPAEQVEPEKPGHRWPGFLIGGETLSMLSLAFWVASLLLPVFIDAHRKEVTTGNRLLMVGWLSVLTLQFAWFANPVLLYAFVRLQSNRRALGAAMLAVALSLHILFALGKPVGLGEVYGYGWGFVLWYAAMAMMLAAAGAHDAQAQHTTSRQTGRWVRNGGLAACLLILISALGVSIIDHRGANNAESLRMADAAFKRGPVCREELAQVSQPLNLAGGIIEVKQQIIPRAESRDQDDGIHNMMDWGMPTLRYSGRDYAYRHNPTEDLLTSVPAAGNVAGAIEVSVNRDFMHARVLAADGRVVVDQTWKQQPGTTYFCPDYSAYPQAIDQPRLLLTQAMALPEVKPVISRHGTQPQSNVIGEILTRLVEPPTKPEPIRNEGCPAGVGWAATEKVPALVKRMFRNGFRIGEKAYFPDSAFSTHALCQGDIVYLYGSDQIGGFNTLSFEKRRLNDFSLIGSSTLRISDSTVHPGPMELHRIDETSEGYTVEVSLPSQGLRLQVRAGMGLAL